MLSRVADSLYWMSRYIERAENIARLVEVNLQLLTDFTETDDLKHEEQWKPIILSSGDEESFYSLYDEANSETVMEFLTFNKENPNSILSCVNQARENARKVRDQISLEMWETLNDQYLSLRALDVRRVLRTGAHDFYTSIKNHSHLFQGLTDATYSRNEGYDFIQIGKFLERAEKTTRIIDIKYHLLLPKISDVGGALDVVQWVAILRSCSALEAYHRIYVADVSPSKVAEFLIFSETFPRSIRYCLKRLDYFLHHVSGTPGGQFRNDAERVCGKMLSDINFTTIKEIQGHGLHEFLDDIQQKLNQVGEFSYATYMFTPPVDLAFEIHQQQEQQQQ